MSISNASRLADFGSGIGTEGAVLKLDNENQRVGIGTTNPQGTLQVGTGVTVYGNSGIVSAVSFYGNLVGNADSATTATSATNAQGLTGTPDITVGNVVGSAATFVNLTVNGTQTIINTEVLDVSDKNIGIGSTSSPSDSLADGAGITIYGNTNKTLTYDNTKKGFEFNIPLDTDETRFRSVSEKVVVAVGNSITIDYTAGDGNIGIITTATGPISLHVTNIPTTNHSFKSISFTVVAIQTTTAYACTSVYFNGTEKSLKYPSGTVSTGTTTSVDYFNFVGIDTIGDGAVASYLVTTNVSGGYRLY